MAVAPSAQLSQLLNFGVIMLNIIFDRKTSWVVDSKVTSESEKDAVDFI
jgi:hypothetical protein